MLKQLLFIIIILMHGKFILIYNFAPYDNKKTQNSDIYKNSNVIKM